VGGSLKLACNVSRDALQRIMISSFRHKGLEVFFRTGSKAGVQPAHAVKLRVQLTALDFAKRVEDLMRQAGDYMR
jgi:plasmid maintenance system killer protein